MKKCIIIILCLLFSIASISQSYNYAYQVGDEKSGNIIAINNKVFYLSKTTSVPSCCHGYASVVGLDENGSEVFRTAIAGYAHLDYYKLALTDDKHLLVYAGTRWRGCDYGGVRFSIAKLDTNGVVLWNQITSRWVQNILPREDNTFDLITNDSMVQFSSSGIFIKKLSLGIGNINSSTRLSNNNILINYSIPNFTLPSFNGFRVIDTSGAVLSDKPTSFATRKIVECSDGTKFAIVSNFLVKYNSGWTAVATTQSILPANMGITGLFSRNDSVFIAGHDAQLKPLYMILNTNLSVLHQSTTNLDYYTNADLYVKRNDVHVFSTGSSLPDILGRNHTFTSYFRVPLQGNFIARNDIGVTDVKIIWDSIFSYFYLQGPVKVFSGFLDANVKVRNFGTDTIYSFSLNHFSSRYAMWTNCHNGLHKSYSATIPPGAEISVNTGTFGIQTFNESALNPDGSVDLSICISSAIPNFKSDSDIANDQSCATLIHQTVGIKEEHLSFQNLKIFPNPSSDFINISNDGVISTIQVFDMTGRLIKDIEGNNHKINLDLRNYDKGLYIFKINSENVTAVRKVMVH